MVAPIWSRAPCRGHRNEWCRRSGGALRADLSVLAPRPFSRAPHGHSSPCKEGEPPTCPPWESTATAERPDRAGLGCRRPRCRACQERTGTPHHRRQYPAAVMCLAMPWRARYKLGVRAIRRACGERVARRANRALHDHLAPGHRGVRPRARATAGPAPLGGAARSCPPSGESRAWLRPRSQRRQPRPPTRRRHPSLASSPTAPGLRGVRVDRARPTNVQELMAALNKRLRGKRR
jgi:hypothetical protein